MQTDINILYIIFGITGLILTSMLSKLINKLEKLQEQYYNLHKDILDIKASKAIHDTIILIPGKES